MLALGVYPEVSLKDARAAADEARRHLHGGVDPGGLRKVQKHSRLGAATNSFESIALEWFAKQKPNRAENHWTKVQWMLEKTLFPWLKTRPISEIKAPELLTVLRRIETRGAIETAKRVKMIAGRRSDLSLRRRHRTCRRRSVAILARCASDTGQDAAGAHRSFEHSSGGSFKRTASVYRALRIRIPQPPLPSSTEVQ